MLLTVLGRAAQFVLALAMMRVSTTLLPPAEMGRISLFTSATLFAGLFLINPVSLFITRRLHAWEVHGQLKRYLNYYWAYLFAIAATASLTLLVMKDFGVIGLQTSAMWVCVLVGGTLLLNTAYLTFVPSLNLLGFQGWFIGLTLATVATGFFVALVLTVYVGRRAEYWLLGLLVGQAIFAGIGGKVFFGKLATPDRSVRHTPIIPHVRVLFAFAWPLSIAAGMTWLHSQSYRFFMEQSLGLPALGLFVAGFGISAGLIAGFESVLTTYFQPFFYKHVSKEDEIEQGKAWTSYASAILPSLLLFSFFIVAAAPELTRLLLGGGYEASAQFVVWGAVAECARVAAGVYGMVAHAKMKTKLLLLPNTIGVVVSITMLWWLMPKFGASGVGIALASASIAVLMTSAFTTRTELKTNLPYRQLTQCLLIGVVFIVGSNISRQTIGTDEMVLISISLICWSAIFLFVLYWLLRPLLDVKRN